MVMNKQIRVVVADNDVEFLHRINDFLDTQDDVKVVSVVRDGLGAVDASKEALPDVVLIDLHLPVLDSIKTIQTIVAQNEHMKILGASSVADDRYAIEAIKAGARGYVKKNGNGALNYEEIVSAIRQVANDEVVLDPALAFHILQEFS